MAGTPVKPSQAFEQHRAEIRQIVARHRASNARVFGSVPRREDDDQSDLDLLVELDEHMTLFHLGGIRYELRELLGIEVDVLTPNALPDSFRDRVLREAVPV
jgi:predicted nucleotidyltransferase